MAAKEAFRVKQLAGYQVKLDYIQQGKRAKDEKLVSFFIKKTNFETFMLHEVYNTLPVKI